MSYPSGPLTSYSMASGPAHYRQPAPAVTQSTLHGWAPAPAPALAPPVEPAAAQQMLALAERRVRELEARLGHLAAQRGSQESVQRLAAERDMLKQRLVEVLSRHGRTDDTHEALASEYFRLWAEADRLNSHLHGVRKDYSVEFAVMHDHMRGLVAEATRARYERDVLTADQSAMESLDARQRAARAELDFAIANFERDRAEHERRVLHGDQLRELRDLRLEVRRLRELTHAQAADVRVLERQFKSEFDARRDLEREARFSDAGRQRAAELHALDDMALELHALRAAAREAERVKNAELAAVLTQARAAIDERNQVVNRLNNASAHAAHWVEAHVAPDEPEPQPEAAEALTPAAQPVPMETYFGPPAPASPVLQPRFAPPIFARPIFAPPPPPPRVLMRHPLQQLPLRPPMPAPVFAPAPPNVSVHALGAVQYWPGQAPRFIPA